MMLLPVEDEGRLNIFDEACFVVNLSLQYFMYKAASLSACCYSAAFVVTEVRFLDEVCF
jgi:hypothetical protein